MFNRLKPKNKFYLSFIKFQKVSKINKERFVRIHLIVLTAVAQMVAAGQLATAGRLFAVGQVVIVGQLFAVGQVVIAVYLGAVLATVRWLGADIFEARLTVRPAGSAD